MAEHRLAEAIDQIDIRVAVDVNQLRSLRSGDDDRVHHILPLTAEARCRARVGKRHTMSLCESLRAGGFPGVTRDQRICVPLLLRGCLRVAGFESTGKYG